MQATLYLDYGTNWTRTALNNNNNNNRISIAPYGRNFTYRAHTSAKSPIIQSLLIRNQTCNHVTTIPQNFTVTELVLHLIVTETPTLVPNPRSTLSRLPSKSIPIFRGPCTTFPPNFVKIGRMLTKRWWKHNLLGGVNNYYYQSKNSSKTNSYFCWHLGLYQKPSSEPEASDEGLW